MADASLVTSSVGTLEATLRDELGARWVRHAVGGLVAVALLSGITAMFGVWPDGTVVACAAVALLLLVLLQRIRGRVTPTWMVFASTGIGILVTPYASSQLVPGIGAAVLLAGVVAIAVFEPRSRVLPLSGALILLVSTTLAVAGGPAYGFIAVPVAAAALVTGGLIGGLRDRLAERIAAVASTDLKYRDLFDRVPVGLYRTDLDGVWLDVNGALADLLGYRKEELVGAPVTAVLADPHDLERLRHRLPDDGTPLVTDLQFVRADGQIIWVRDRTRPVTDDTGEVLWFEGELQDITQQIEHVERLKELIASKSELIAAVSHELRTPLTAVVGFLDVLGEDPDAERAEMLRMAAEQAHEVAGIVDDLLTAARLDNRELVVRSETVDLVAAVRAAIRSLGDPMVLPGLPAQLDGWGDASRVRQILRNLIGNAYRYGTPPVSIRSETRDGHVRIVVADRGPMIPEPVRARMFEPFFTTGVGASQPGSIGLGLAVSRRLAQRMGGDLLHLRAGGENRFILELPREHTATQAA